MDKKIYKNKIDNLDKQQQAKLAKHISKLEKKATYQTYLQKTKTTCQRRAQEKNLLKLCLQRIKLMKALMLI